MLSRDYKDMAGGGLLLVVGAMFAWYAASHYDLGTVRRMGPGMFPVALGAVLAMFGFLIGIPAWFRQGQMPEIRVFTPIFVLAGVASFALLIRPFGLIPAVLSVVIISSLAELKIQPVSLTILSTILCLIAWLVFGVGLGLNVSMFRWPY